jgi:hypothetical protein
MPMLRKDLSRLVVVEETAAVEAQTTKTRQALKIPEEVKMTAAVVQPLLVQAAQTKQAHRQPPEQTPPNPTPAPKPEPNAL